MRTAAVLLCILSAGCSRAPQQDSVKADAHPPARDAAVVLSPAAQRQAGVAVERVQARPIPQTLRSTGRLTNNENTTWRVGAITEGRIVSVLANPGDPVKSGQVMARMHSHQIHDGRADYRKAVAELSRLKSVESFARRARDRARRLFELKAGSLEQAEHAETELRNAEIGVANGQIEVERARRHLVEFLGVSAEDDGHDDENDLIPVRSPAAGTVLSRKVTPGTVVTPANDLFEVADLSTLWAIAEVNEEHLTRLRAGMPVTVHVQAYPNENFLGRIGKLGESLDPATRTVKVRVDVPNSRGRLKPEMYATTEIELGVSDSAIFVPAAAIQEMRGEQVVFQRTAPDRFEPRHVEPGRSVEGAVEIVRGLKGGEEIATAGSFILKSEYLKASLKEE